MGQHVMGAIRCQMEIMSAVVRSEIGVPEQEEECDHERDAYQ